MDAPPEGLLKIGDFSQIAQVTVRTLRHYADLGLLKPAHIDPWSSYRYYAIDQLPGLNRILALKGLGLSLDEIAELLRSEPGPDQLRSMLEQQRARLEQEMADRARQLALVEARLRQIEEPLEGAFEVAIGLLPGLSIASRREIVPRISSMPDYRCQNFAELYDLLACRVVAVGEPEMVIYHHSEYVDENIDMEVAVPVNAEAAEIVAQAGLTFRELPAEPLAATITHRGPLWDIPRAISALYLWTARSRYEAGGPYRELHLSGREHEMADPDGETPVVMSFALPLRER